MIDKIKYIVSCIYTVFKFIEQCFISPIKKVLKFCEPLTNRYKKLWNKYCYDKYGDFLYKKAGMMIIGTIASMYIVLCILGFLFDLSYYIATKHEETIYLSDSVELDSDESIWGVKGCPTRECDSNTALYFRIKMSWFNQLWNIVHNGKLFFPDAIAAGVPTGQTECSVISYGLRYRILMIYNYYPQILQVRCQASE